MEKEIVVRLEKLLGHKLEAEEKERLQRIKDTLQISDNDALWDILVALEYQRTYYEVLPEKIRKITVDIFRELSQTAGQGIVMERTGKLHLKNYGSTLLIGGVVTLGFLLVYGSLLLWAGMCIGPQLPPLLRMPVGIIIGALCLCVGIVFGILAARDFSEGNVRWHKHIWTALGFLLPGTWALSYVMW